MVLLGPPIPSPSSATCTFLGMLWIVSTLRLGVWFFSALVVALALWAVALVRVFAASWAAFAWTTLLILFLWLLFLDAKETFDTGNDRCKKAFLGRLARLLVAVFLVWTWLPILSLARVVPIAVLLVAWTLISWTFRIVLFVLLRTVAVPIPGSSTARSFLCVIGVVSAFRPRLCTWWMFPLLWLLSILLRVFGIPFALWLWLWSWFTSGGRTGLRPRPRLDRFPFTFVSGASLWSRLVCLRGSWGCRNGWLC